MQKNRSDQMISPEFIVGGAQKAGTTSLYYMMQQHPQILLPNHDEAHFFDIEENFQQGLHYYDNLFEQLPHDTEHYKVGDFTANYLLLDYIPKRISDTLGSNIKLLFILRNPVDRAYSHYWMNVRNGVEDLSFEEALKEEKHRFEGGSLDDIKKFSYVERGLYAKLLNRYYQRFPPENIKPLIFEELFGPHQMRYLNQIQEFLGVNVLYLHRDVPKFQTGVSRFKLLSKLLSANNKRLARLRKQLPLPKFIRRYLRNLLLKKPEGIGEKRKEELMRTYFYQDIKELERMLNRELGQLWL